MGAAKRRRVERRKATARVWDAAMLRYFGYWCVPVALVAAWIGERALSSLGL